jgi:hypothetical protein
MAGDINDILGGKCCTGQNAVVCTCNFELAMGHKRANSIVHRSLPKLADMIIPRVPSANFAVFKNSSSREAE